MLIIRPCPAGISKNFRIAKHIDKEGTSWHKSHVLLYVVHCLLLYFKLNLRMNLLFQTGEGHKAIFSNRKIID
eukprot:UN04198